MVLIHGAFHQEGILGVEHTGNALLCAFDKYTGLLGVHVVPHTLVGLVTRVLRRKEKKHNEVCCYALSLKLKSNGA